MRTQALDGLDAYNALVLGLVGKQWRPRHVADRIDPIHVRAIEGIYDNSAAFRLDAQPFQAKIFGIASHSNGRDHALDRERLCPSLPALDRSGDVFSTFL